MMVHMMNILWHKFPDICLTVDGKPRKKPQPGTDPTGDRTRARCVRDNDVTPRPHRWSVCLLRDIYSWSMFFKNYFPKVLLRLCDFAKTCKLTAYHCIDPGGPVVIILATGSEVRDFKPGRGRLIISERKNPEYDFLRKGSKAVGPVS